VPGSSGGGIPGSGGLYRLGLLVLLGAGLSHPKSRNKSCNKSNLVHPHGAPQASIGPASRETLIVRGFSDADNLSAKRWTATLLAS
jgi:hypothetical protein